MSTSFILSRIIIFGDRISDLKNFYTKIFNFEVVEEYDNYWIVLKAGSIELALHKIGKGFEPTEGSPFRAESNVKITFTYNGDLNLFRKYLIENDITISEIKRINGINSLICDGEDPEGNVFQIVQILE